MTNNLSEYRERKVANLKVIVYYHPNSTEQSSKEAHNQLNLHDQRVSDILLGLLVNPLHKRQNEPIQRRSSQDHNKPYHVLPSGLTIRTVPTGTQCQNHSRNSQQHYGVHRISRELLLHQEESEDGGEREVGGLNKGKGGHGKKGYAVRVEVVVEAGEDADDGRSNKQRRLHREKLRFRGAAGFVASLVDVRDG